MEKIFDIWLKIIWCLIYAYAFLGSFIVGWKWHNLIFFFTSDSEDDGICEENIDLLRVIQLIFVCPVPEFYQIHDMPLSTYP